MLSPTCSIRDFWLSGCSTSAAKCNVRHAINTAGGIVLTFMAAPALSVKDCLPVSDMVIWAGSDDRTVEGWKWACSKSMLASYILHAHSSAVHSMTFPKVSGSVMGPAPCHRGSAHRARDRGSFQNGESACHIWGQASAASATSYTLLEGRSSSSPAPSSSYSATRLTALDRCAGTTSSSFAYRLMSPGKLCSRLESDGHISATCDRAL